MLEVLEGFEAGVDGGSGGVRLDVDRDGEVDGVGGEVDGDGGEVDGEVGETGDYGWGEGCAFDVAVLEDLEDGGGVRWFLSGTEYGDCVEEDGEDEGHEEAVCLDMRVRYHEAILMGEVELTWMGGMGVYHRMFFLLSIMAVVRLPSMVIRRMAVSIISCVYTTGFGTPVLC